MAEGPEGEENHLLIVGLRITLVTLVVFVGILIVGRIAVSAFHLSEDSPGLYSNGPVPVSPITTQPSALPTLAQPSDLPALNYPPAPTDVPPLSETPPGLVLLVFPTSVSSGQEFTFSGTYAGRSGSTLQLQRLENGSWLDYPNQIDVTMGTYSTTASSTMTGTNSFRVYDQAADRASNVVSILVR